MENEGSGMSGESEGEEVRLHTFSDIFVRFCEFALQKYVEALLYMWICIVIVYPSSSFNLRLNVA